MLFRYLLTFSLSARIFGQILNTTWNNVIDNNSLFITMGLSSGEFSNLIAFAQSSSSIYVIGSASGITIENQTPIGFSNAFLMKYDSNGKRIWTRFWGSGDSNIGDYPIAVAVDQETEDIYVTGGAGQSLPGSNFTFLAPAGSFNSFLTKFDKDGKEIWSRMWGGIIFYNNKDTKMMLDRE
jgi:hypothetical protein